MRTKTLQTGNEPIGLRRDHGFTLVELVLVLLVMTLVAAITFPAMMRGRSSFHLRAVARDLIGSVRLARETAVTEQKVMVMQVDSQTQQVTISDDVGDGARMFAMPGDVKIQVLTRPRGSEAEPRGTGDQEPLRIRFLPNGSSDSAEFSLTSDTGAVLKVSTDPITGSAHIVVDQGVKVP